VTRFSHQYNSGTLHFGPHREAVSSTMLQSLDPMICTPRKSKSLMIRTTLAPKGRVSKPYWHKRLQCKSYQRRASAAAGSGARRERTL
jgi:hypothetical protein